MTGALGGIDEGDGADLARFFAEFGCRVDRSKEVGDVREREDFDFWGEQAVELIEFEKAFRGDWDEAQFCPGALSDDLPWDEVAVVLHFCEEDDIARFQEVAAPSVGDEVDGFCGAASEDDLVGGAGVEEAGDFGPGVFESGGGAGAEFVEATVHVGVVVFVVVNEGVDDLPWFLGGGGVVEVDKGVPVDLLVKDWEIGTKGFEIQSLIEVRVHCE